MGPSLLLRISENVVIQVNQFCPLLHVQGKTELLDIKDNEDGTHTVNYVPSVEGPHSLMVKYAGHDSYSR